MKSRLISFVAGVLTVSALAVPVLGSGGITLDVRPTSLLVNGTVFQPKDGYVFVADGVTYAPVRALAEAYGLNVGYDAAQSLITVSNGGSNDSAPAGDFASQWAVKQKPVTGYGDVRIFTASYQGPLAMADFKTWWKSLGADYIRAEAERIAADAQAAVGGSVTMYFDVSGYALGTAYAYGSFEQSDFRAASAWIK